MAHASYAHTRVAGSAAGDIVVDGDVLEPANILDPTVMQKVRNWCSSGVLALFHFGTPCATFSRARKHGAGGPPHIRSDKHLTGIPGISAEDAEKVHLGFLFLVISLEPANRVFHCKGAWSIKNPASSMLWLLPQVLQFIAQHPHDRNQLDLCQFCGESKKPTVFLASGFFLAQIARQCSGETADHVHVPLKGTVRIDGQETFRAKLAQVCPHELCELYASGCDSLFTSFVQALSPPSPDQSMFSQDDPLGLQPGSGNGSQFRATFARITPANERKRVLGQPCRFQEHRQATKCAEVWSHHCSTK